MIRKLTRITPAAVALAIVFSIIPSIGFAQNARRPISHDDFDAWRSISAAPAISRDGGWLAYAYMPLEGDGDVIVRELATGREIRVPVGALPPPPMSASEANPERPAPRREVTLQFTGDSRFLIATRFPAQADTLQAKRDKKKADEMPKDGIVIINLATGDAEVVDAVKNFQVASKQEGGSWLAYLKESLPEKKDADKTPAEATPAVSPEAGKNSPASKEKESASKASEKKKERKYGSELVLRDLSANSSKVTPQSFPNVMEYSLTYDGKTLAYTVSSRIETENGVYVVTPNKQDKPRALDSGPGNYQKFTWDRAQSRAAFMVDREDPENEAPRFVLYYWSRGEAAASRIVDNATAGMPAGYGVSGNAAPSFSFDGKKILVPAAPLPKPPDKRLKEMLDEEKVNVDLWHWNDDYLPMVQKQRAPKERNRTYIGVYDLSTRRYVQLASEELFSVTLSPDGTKASGMDESPYRKRIDYDGVYQDLYQVDIATGEKKLVKKELDERNALTWSHNDRWMAFFDGGQWFSVNTRDGSIRNLTGEIPAVFFDELSDVPQSAPAYGSVGWTTDGDSLLVYDRYDLWQLYPDGRAARNLTGGFGRAGKIQLRIQSVEAREPDDPQRGTDLAKPLVLRGEDQVTRATGFFRIAKVGATSSEGTPAQLLWADKNYRYLGRALSADMLLLSASRFDEYPDLHTTNTAFATPHKVSNGGAQLDAFLWGSSELLTYRNTDGIELPVALYKPANFDPNKKYPMIVYIYERLSQVVNNFYPPVPSTVINVSFYTSNGYLVLTPDIAYTVGHPGQSALKCVLPAVDEIVRRGYVDENAIGIEGHSWGGYQTAYLITQTTRFRAAEAGALVSNMTSAYSGIRWGSGRARQFQYEKTQSRIGVSLEEAPELYLENSPVFYVSRVQTPVLMMHNDLDDAVPWYQTIEYFLALRRAGKEAYFFNYNNEYHGLRRRADQKDFAKRMNQFFDHFLKGAPRPEWMEKGIPYIDRDEEKLRFQDTK